MPDGVRLFFALRPPAPVSHALADSVAALTPGARPVHPEDLHLTLAFLGAVSDSAAAERAGARAAAGAVPCTLMLERFGLWRRRGIAWAAPASVPEALEALHAALRSALAEEGWALEKRPFRPHVTLARQAHAAPRETTVPSWTVRHLVLLESGPPPAPRYCTTASWPLGSGAPEGR